MEHQPKYEETSFIFSEESVGVFPILTISDLPLMLAELMGNVR